MKKATLLAISFMIVAVTCMSFSSGSVNSTAGNTKKTLTEKTYYYVAWRDYQRLEPGHVLESDLRQQTIAEWAFTDPSYWTTTDTNVKWPSTNMTFYIYYITFEEEWDADGSSDGQLTLQEALDRLWYEFNSNGTMPQSVQIDPYIYTYITVHSCSNGRFY